MTESDYLYFACGWVIQPNINYTQLKSYAEQAECKLRLISPLYTNEQGLTVLTFAVKVEDEPQLVQFIQTAGAEMGLTHWYGVPQDYYESGKPFNIDLEPMEVRVQWLKVMNAYGEQNEKVKQTLENSAE